MCSSFFSSYYSQSFSLRPSDHKITTILTLLFYSSPSLLPSLGDPPPLLPTFSQLRTGALLSPFLLSSVSAQAGFCSFPDIHSSEAGRSVAPFCSYLHFQWSICGVFRRYRVWLYEAAFPGSKGDYYNSGCLPLMRSECLKCRLGRLEIVSEYSARPG